ncbi:MAG: polysaccharide deacetylase family protein [Bacteroidetes bacterium]|nr:polysaccharide deacetylase family protein [Bacteroidota bacterium]MBK9671377.1 polysaccharide deacetylase family protein [Bacteroidota bacterium]MBK9799336.1 polysaccharide deacetylase family protein [Bacteroidota bacterium]MBP6412204.1 polysaccharide deacetylase family protein [Bacteroidia bacterium]
MILVFTPKINNRIRYIFRLLFTDVLGIGVRLTENVNEFKLHDGAKINYSGHAFGDELFFMSKPFLLETGIKDQEITVFDWEGIKAFFPTSRSATLPFDPFAASFYLVSRYEEYLPTIHDKHNRFEALESLAFQNNFLHLPLVNIWAEKIKHLISAKYPEVIFPIKKFSHVPTIDIDNAFAFREKGFMRSIGASLRSLSKFDFKEFAERAKVILGMQADPYDTYKLLHDLHAKHQLHPVYFFLFAAYGLNDKNVPTRSQRFRYLIKSIADTSDVGIHPSYNSNFKVDKLEREVHGLAKVLNREITRSRQHFLKLTFPDTYRNLINLDITDDYTMGYASEIGFRASICDSYNFYDLDLEIETKLRLHPFQVMDATLNFYLQISPEESIVRIKQIIDEVHKVKGTFISLWHNETIAEYKFWKGWSKVYLEMLEYAATKQ